MQHKQEALLFSKERNASNKEDQYVVYLELSSFLVLQNDNSLSESYGKISWRLLDTMTASSLSFCQTWCIYYVSIGSQGFWVWKGHEFDNRTFEMDPLILVNSPFRSKQSMQPFLDTQQKVSTKGSWMFVVRVPHWGVTWASCFHQTKLDNTIQHEWFKLSNCFAFLVTGSDTPINSNRNGAMPVSLNDRILRNLAALSLQTWTKL